MRETASPRGSRDTQVALLHCSPSIAEQLESLEGRHEEHTDLALVGRLRMHDTAALDTQ
jgi:hypothetical protein